MFRDTKEININVIVEYEYDSELEKINEIIKSLLDLKGIKKIDVDKK